MGNNIKSDITQFLLSHTPKHLQSDMLNIFGLILSKNEKLDISEFNDISPHGYEDILDRFKKYNIIKQSSHDLLPGSLINVINNPIKESLFRRLYEQGCLKLNSKDILIFSKLYVFVLGCICHIF